MLAQLRPGGFVATSKQPKHHTDLCTGAKVAEAAFFSVPTPVIMPSPAAGVSVGESIVARPLLYDLRGKRVFVAGHKGMAGSAIVRRLSAEKCEILTVDRANSRSDAAI